MNDQRLWRSIVTSFISKPTRSYIHSKSGVLCTLLCVMSLSVSIPQSFAKRSGGSSEKVDFDRVKQQGITYFTKKMYPLAQEQFDLAYSTPQGKGDFVVVYYRGYLAEKQLKLEKAFAMAELAVQISDKGTKERSQAQQLLDELNGRFSYVKIVPAEQETNNQGRIYLESKGRIINKKKREQFESIRLRFRSTDITIPTKMYLPYGRYKANNVPFVIKRNVEEIPEVSLFLHIIQTKQKVDNSVVLYTGLGVTGAAVLGFGAYLLLKPEDQQVNNVRLNFRPLSPDGM